MCKMPKCDIKKALISLCLPTYIIYALSISDEWQEKDCKLGDNKESEITKKHDFFITKLCLYRHYFDCHVVENV